MVKRTHEHALPVAQAGVATPAWANSSQRRKQSFPQAIKQHTSARVSRADRGVPPRSVLTSRMQAFPGSERVPQSSPRTVSREDAGHSRRDARAPVPPPRAVQRSRIWCPLIGREPLRRVRFSRSEATPRNSTVLTRFSRPPASAHEQIGRGAARPYQYFAAFFVPNYSSIASSPTGLCLCPGGAQPRVWDGNMSSIRGEAW